MNVKKFKNNFKIIVLKKLNFYVQCFYFILYNYKI